MSKDEHEMIVKILSDIQSEVKEQRKDVTQLKVDIAKLKITSGMWGSIAAAIISSAILAGKFLIFKD